MTAATVDTRNRESASAVSLVKNLFEKVRHIFPIMPREPFMIFH